MYFIALLQPFHKDGWGKCHTMYTVEPLLQDPPRDSVLITSLQGTF